MWQFKKMEGEMAAPQGFTYAGRLYASSGSGQTDDVKEDHWILLPLNTVLDATYDQPAEPFRNSGGGAQSTLTAADIPPGVYVECDGSDTHGKRWAVLPPYSGLPILSATFNRDYTVRQFQLTFGLYADTGSSLGNGGANTIVDIWYKPKA
jgi:hypothetical protein